MRKKAWPGLTEITPALFKAQPGRMFFQIGEDLRGDLWIASRELGVQHLREDGSVIEAFDRVMLEKRNIALAFDPKRDGLWLTSNLGGLGFLKDGKLIERYAAQHGLGDGIICDPQVDKDGGVWVGRRVGLAHLMNGNPIVRLFRASQRSRSHQKRSLCPKEQQHGPESSQSPCHAPVTD
jgi:ligand-binding sensor domain-containing protein